MYEAVLSVLKQFYKLGNIISNLQMKNVRPDILDNIQVHRLESGEAEIWTPLFFLQYLYASSPCHPGHLMENIWADWFVSLVVELDIECPLLIFLISEVSTQL